MTDKTIRIDSEGIKFPLDKKQKSIIINNNEYFLPDDVWGLMLKLSWERDYFQREWYKIQGWEVPERLKQ